MTILDRAYTDIQYKQNTKLKDDNNNMYLVLSSLDLHWLYKTDETKGKYLTMLKFIGTLNKEVTNDNTSKKPNTDTTNDSANGVH